MSAGNDWEDAQPASTPLALPADSTEESKSTEVAKAAPAEELPLFLDSKTTPTQTKPDDPTRELAAGVTVASKSAPKPAANRAVDTDKPAKVELLHVSADKSPAPQVERSPESLSSRQASLSYGGDDTEVALVDQRTALKRQDTSAQKPVTQPRQFLPRSEPGNRALPPATVKRSPLQAVKPQPVKQQPVLSAQPAGGAQKVKIETQQLADGGARNPAPLKSPATTPAKTTASAQKPATVNAPKPAINPATKPASQTAKPLTAANKPVVQTAKPPVVAKPSTLTAQAKPKAQLNGGVRVMTPRREITQPKVEAPVPAQAAPAIAHRTEAASVEKSLPILPAGEELVTADRLAAVPAPVYQPARESVAPAPIPPVPAFKQTNSQSEALPAESNVVINTVSSAPVLTPSIVVMALLAIALFALWLWMRRRPTPPTPLTLLQQKAVSVIETISLAPGRQIVLVEVSGNALVLGVTSQSINLLERLPLAVLAQNYQPTVESIIVRESAQAAQWAEAPRMAAAGGGGPVMPFSYPRASGTAVRTSLAELRREQTSRIQSLSVVGAEAERD